MAPPPFAFSRTAVIAAVIATGVASRGTGEEFSLVQVALTHFPPSSRTAPTVSGPALAAAPPASVVGATAALEEILHKRAPSQAGNVTEAVALMHSHNGTGAEKKEPALAEPSDGVFRPDPFASTMGFFSLMQSERWMTPAPTAESEKPPKGSDIWNNKASWTTVYRVHPNGIVTTLHTNVLWSQASYMSFYGILLLSLLAYPAAWIVLIVLCMLLVSMCVAVGNTEPQSSDTARASTDMILPVVTVDNLSPAIRRLYLVWEFFCHCIPALTVFGVPVSLGIFIWSRPQEVFSVLMVLNTGVMYTNGVYMLLFGVRANGEVRRTSRLDLSNGLEGLRSSLCKQHRGESFVPAGATVAEQQQIAEEVIHWVILPQFEEDAEVVAMAIKSIAQSRLAKTSICVLLAMEARETAAREKVEVYAAEFAGSFREMFATYHPAGLPNDPPGKASNTAWAFKELKQHLEATNTDASNVVLTVADADSEFHEHYFELVSYSYVSQPKDVRDLRLWQSPIFHVKNYHRQPAPVAIGSFITAFVEMAGLADPNAVRFPYSTYSLSYSLASRVGGWDPQWIAEDWHMGIKCFLHTFGKTKVLPIMVPTLNYTPEEASWSGTIYARWAQAKRHALGFSDLTYYFMTTPLVVGFAMSDFRNTGRHRLKDVFLMLLAGMSMIVKIVNTHVLLGVATTYGFMTFVLKELMEVMLGKDRLIDFFFDRTTFCPFFLVTASGLCTLGLVIVWIHLYNLVKHRIEKCDDESTLKATIFRYNGLHLIYLAASLQLFGGMFFALLTLATWKAALKVLTEKSFHYEVASKPTKETRLKA